MLEAMADSASGFPDEDELHRAALRYLARYASTEAGLRRVLLRKIERSVRTTADLDQAVVSAARQSIEKIIAKLAETGLLNDPAFAEGRARTLRQSGQSNRLIRAKLLAKGVSADLADRMSGSANADELAAALVTARKRRIGPYRTLVDPDQAQKTKELMRLVRAGFALEVARQVISMTAEEAEERIRALRL